MNFYISDLHFGHKKIIEYESRPFNSLEEMETICIDKWNKKVGKSDNVYTWGFVFVGAMLRR